MSRITKLYGIWQAMRQRISRKTHVLYPRYGGRGIKICDSWGCYKTFDNWAVANGYVAGLSIDRIDNDGDYCPENCHWITRSAHATKTLTKDAPRKGVNHPMARYTEDDIRKIRSLRDDDGLTFKKIGEMYDTSASHINRIHKRRSWSHVV